MQVGVSQSMGYMIDSLFLYRVGVLNLAVAGVGLVT